MRLSAALYSLIYELQGRHSQYQVAPQLPCSPDLRKCQISDCHWKSVEALFYRSLQKSIEAFSIQSIETLKSRMVSFLTCQLCCFKTLQMQTIISLYYLKNTFTLVERTNAANKASTKCHPSKQIFLTASSNRCIRSTVFLNINIRSHCHCRLQISQFQLIFDNNGIQDGSVYTDIKSQCHQTNIFAYFRIILTQDCIDNSYQGAQRKQRLVEPLEWNHLKHWKHWKYNSILPTLKIQKHIVSLESYV